MIKFHFLYILAVSLIFFTLYGNASEEHGDEWEFTAILEVEDTDEVYNFVFAKNSDTYAANEMKVVIIPTSDHGADGIAAVESTADAY